MRLVEKRPVRQYCDGQEECDSGENKIDEMIKVISDCHAVVVMRIGYSPLKRLEEKNIKVIQVCSPIEEAIKNAVNEMENAPERMMTVG